MRPIKCRAWDEVDKKMWFTGQEGETDENGDAVFQTYFDENGCLCAVLITEMDVGCSQPMVTDRELNVTEYTGLKDKNYVKIFEGDIVKIQYCDTLLKIEYEEGSFGTYFKTGYCHELGDVYRGCEVIGNIFEHPELLGETE